MIIIRQRNAVRQQRQWPFAASMPLETSAQIRGNLHFIFKSPGCDDKSFVLEQATFLHETVMLRTEHYSRHHVQGSHLARQHDEQCYCFSSSYDLPGEDARLSHSFKIRSHSRTALSSWDCILIMICEFLGLAEGPAIQC